ncbi:MAG: DUF4872 domain-containing protein [Actinomycetota bacterium]|nr:DUF4872 domain-containing protein [Actinomycetota bacterium]
MTRNRDFKHLVRARMDETGERYSTARAHVLAAATPHDRHRVAGLLDSVVAIGGQQPDLAAARNLCVNAGVTGPGGEPLGEALAFGLAGGVGFLYGVFEYADGPTMTIVARNRSMPDPFCEPLFGRAGATIEVSTTTGAKKAATELDRALDAGRSVLCTVGAGGLAHLGLPDDEAAMAPHLVGVVGRDGDHVLVDDRSPEPIVVERATFDTARAAYRQAKHRMVSITDVDSDHDWPGALRQAVTAGTTGYDTPPVPQFAANVGRAGLTKFARLLTDERDPKRWPRVFGSGRRAALGLGRLHDCVEWAYTAPSAGRALQAEFLREAAAIADEPGWVDAAERFDASATAWAEVARLAADAHPNLQRYAELSAARAAALDGRPDPATMRSLADEQRQLVDDCDLSATEATAAFAAIAEVIDRIAALERDALDVVRDR